MKSSQYKLSHLIPVMLLLIVQVKSFAQQTRQTKLFNDGWKFYKGDFPGAEKPGMNDADWRELDLPHDWSIEGPFDAQWASATGYLPGGIGWYRKTFDIEPNERSKNIYIYFDGVYKNSEVWINGHFLGKRPSGYTSFQFEITKFINKNGKNIVSVKADHTDFADSRWYTGSGIYRNVYLITTDPVHVDLWGIKFTTPEVSGKNASAKVAVSVVNNSTLNSQVTVKVTLLDLKGKAVANAQQPITISAESKGDVNLSFKIRNPLLWSADNPNLYKLHVALVRNAIKIDELSEEVGFRWFRFDKDKGFFLNGKNMKLKGVCIHDDAGALGVAVPEEVWIRRLNLLKQAGCNSIRMSHNPHADYLYKLMDRMGFLTIDEAFDEWELGKNKWIKGWNVGTPGKDGYHKDFKEWAALDLTDMVLRNYNRPSIILWSIGNEIDYPNDPYTHEILNTGRNPQIYGKGYTQGYPAATRLGELAKELVAIVKKYDTTRPVTAGLAGVVMSNEVGFSDALDVAGYNYQEYRYADDHIKYPERIMYGSENGMSSNAWNAVKDNNYIFGQYLWTGIDYLGEARTWPSRSNESGLIDLAGFPKAEFYFRQSLWTSNPMIYIGTATGVARNNTGNKRRIVASWNYKEGDSVRISCFTNCYEAELLLNGKSLGRKRMADARDQVITWDVIFQPGELLVKGYNNEKEVSSHKLITAGEPYAIKATADRNTFQRNKKQLAHIVIKVLDQKGNEVFNTANEITVSIEGPARLLGLESGSSVSHEDYMANKRKPHNGHLLAYIQSQQKAGVIKVRLTSPGLQSQVLEFK